jgi:xanthine dehydrogenase accessory factor
MTCGGQAELLIEPFQEFAPGAKVFFAELCARLCRGERGWLATAIRPEGNTLFVERFLLAGSACVGSLAAPDQVLPEDLCRAKTPDAPCLVERGALRYFLEPLAPPVTVYVFGGGHIAARLVPLCRLLGFRVAVVDDRAEYASPERFPDAGSLVVASFDQAVKSLPIDEESYAVIATRGHDSDAAILRHALALRPRYIGMIGSVRKRDLIFDQLRREGVSADALGRVACPIGLSIGAETPEEIAVSIAAELVAARAGVKTRNAG